MELFFPYSLIATKSRYILKLVDYNQMPVVINVTNAKVPLKFSFESLWEAGFAESTHLSFCSCCVWWMSLYFNLPIHLHSGPVSGIVSLDLAAECWEKKQLWLSIIVTNLQSLVQRTWRKSLSLVVNLLELSTIQMAHWGTHALVPGTTVMHPSLPTLCIQTSWQRQGNWKIFSRTFTQTGS